MCKEAIGTQLDVWILAAHLTLYYNFTYFHIIWILVPSFYILYCNFTFTSFEYWPVIRLLYSNFFFVWVIGLSCGWVFAHRTYRQLSVSMFLAILSELHEAQALSQVNLTSRSVTCFRTALSAGFLYLLPIGNFMLILYNSEMLCYVINWYKNAHLRCTHGLGRKVR
jgi:hypothetical protein